MTEIDGWVRLDEYCKARGIRQNTFQQWLNRGYIQRGTHYSSPSGGRPWVHLERCDTYLKEKGKMPTEAAPAAPHQPGEEA